VALARLYHDATLHKPDFRGAAAAINRSVEAGDVVLVDGPNPELVFNHYYTGDAVVHDLRPLAEASGEELAATLAAATAGKATAWELLYFHTPGPVQVWLALHGWPAAPQDHNGIRTLAYALSPGPPLQPQAVAFGSALTLDAAGVDGAAAAGDLVRVTTQWQVHAPLPDYKFSLRLVDAGGQVLRADDYVPQNWFAPTSAWVVGAPAVDQHALRLPEDLAAGSYTVTLRLYDPAGGVAVDTAQGQDVPLGQVVVHE